MKTVIGKFVTHLLVWAFGPDRVVIVTQSGERRESAGSTRENAITGVKEHDSEKCASGFEFLDAPFSCSFHGEKVLVSSLKALFQDK